jgi:hypothetical protein
MQNRRQFMTMLVRGGILASLALLGGVLVRRWEEAGECSGSYACGNCTLSERCALPEADKFRHAGRQQKETTAKDGRNGK